MIDFANFILVFTGNYNFTINHLAGPKVYAIFAENIMLELMEPDFEKSS